MGDITSQTEAASLGEAAAALHHDLESVQRALRHTENSHLHRFRPTPNPVRPNPAESPPPGLRGRSPYPTRDREHGATPPHAAETKPYMPHVRRCTSPTHRWHPAPCARRRRHHTNYTRSRPSWCSPPEDGARHTTPRHATQPDWHAHETFDRARCVRPTTRPRRPHVDSTRQQRGTQPRRISPVAERRRSAPRPGMGQHAEQPVPQRVAPPATNVVKAIIKVRLDHDRACVATRNEPGN